MSISKAVIPFLAAAFLLTGCISKLPTEVELPMTPLTDENSTVESDPQNRFTLRIPNGYNFFLDQEQDNARLFRINNGANQTQMFFEENLSTVDETVQLLIDNAEVSDVSREEIEINGMQGEKVLVKLASVPDQYTPYYFLQGGSFVYVFSLAAGSPFEHYLGIINSFTLAGE